MTGIIVLLILCILGCGFFLQSRNNTIRTIGGILAVVGLMFCVYVGYSLGGWIGALIGFIIMGSVIGSGVNSSNELEANEYLANKGRDYKEGKK